ncbi:MAG: ABC transporter ATP-binding protein [Actinomycetaceae bacterium]|nr:ABC transporter ATP-binding protein [Actinomycetaceae bacterium]
MAKKKSKGGIRTSFRLLRPGLAENKWLIVGGALALMLEVAFRVMEPWPLKLVIDSVLAAHGMETQGPRATLGLLFALGAVHVIIVGGRAGCNYLATVSFAAVGSHAASSLRSRAFQHVQRLSAQFHSRNRSADTVQRIVSDVSRMQEVVVTAGLPLVANSATFLVMVGVMIYLDVYLALVVLAALIAFAIASSGSSHRITAAARRARAGEGHLANTAQESLSSIKLVQAYGLESHIEDRFGGANKSSIRSGIRSLRLAARLERSTDLIVGAAVAAVMVGGGIRVLDSAMTVGDLVIFVTYLRTTMKPLRDMAKYTGRISRAAASGERVAELMAREAEIVSAPGAVALRNVAGEVTFNNVTTAYEGTPILRNLSAYIRPGEHVAVIGPSGAGKSTLLSLLSRGQDPVSGQVLLDGWPLTHLDLADLRSQVTVLHQEAMLLAGTIRENIALGRIDATDEEIVAAAQAANAHGFISELPDGYDTVVGERGSTLSGGQRQRIAIARALLRDSPVILLDEATTGLDPEAVSVVLDALDTLIQGRTAISVTHQAEAALRASRIWWIENGGIQMDGSPRELLETSPAFAQWANANSAASAALYQTSAHNPGGDVK